MWTLFSKNPRTGKWAKPSPLLIVYNEIRLAWLAPLDILGNERSLRIYEFTELGA
jgi:hypothetical protein